MLPGAVPSMEESRRGGAAGTCDCLGEKPEGSDYQSTGSSCILFPTCVSSSLIQLRGRLTYHAFSRRSSDSYRRRDPSGANLRYDPLYDRIKEARREEKDEPPPGMTERDRKVADNPQVIKIHDPSAP